MYSKLPCWTRQFLTIFKHCAACHPILPNPYVFKGHKIFYWHFISHFSMVWGRGHLTVLSIEYNSYTVAAYMILLLLSFTLSDIVNPKTACKVFYDSYLISSRAIFNHWKFRFHKRHHLPKYFLTYRRTLSLSLLQILTRVFCICSSCHRTDGGLLCRLF